MAGGSLKDGGYGAAEPTQAWVMYSGFDVAKDSSYAYQGIILSLNRDISKDGFQLRVYGSHDDFRYDNSGVTGGRTSGDFWQGDAMIGYKINRGMWWAAGYVGVDYQDFELTPDDPTSRARGSEVGFKVAADAATLRNEGLPLYFAIGGEYSTAFDSYWARARVGVNHDRFTFGPEVSAVGNVDFDAQRVGAFVTFDLKLAPTMPIEVTVNGGYQFVDDDNNSGRSSCRGGGEGAYGGVTFVVVF